jgi:hypothetical protein
MPQPQEMYSCEGMRKLQQYIRKVATDGETAVIRQILSHANITDEQAAQRYRTRSPQQ